MSRSLSLCFVFWQSSCYQHLVGRILNFHQTKHHLHSLWVFGEHRDLFSSPKACRIFTLISLLMHFWKSCSPQRGTSVTRFPVVNDWSAKPLWTKGIIKTPPASSSSRCLFLSDRAGKTSHWWDTERLLPHQLFPFFWLDVVKGST